MTQLGYALRAAGVVTVEERLREIAVGVLAVHANSREAAAHALYAKVQHEADLLGGLFEPYRDLAVRRLLGAVESEMRRHELAQQEKAREGSQKYSDDRITRAPRPDGGQPLPGNQSGLAPVPSPHRAAQERVGAVLRLTMLDTFKIEGTAIGDMQAGAARSWARREGRHVRWVMMLTANMPAADLIRRWISADDADDLWARSLEDGDA